MKLSWNRSTGLGSGVLTRIGIGALAALLAQPGFTQDAAPAGNQSNPANLGTIEVTGSRIRRTDMETAAPVTTISRQQIERTGATSLSDLLKVITSNENGLSQEQTLGFAAGSSNINLRGLGAQYTLVLLNGRRIAPYGRFNVTSANIETAVNIDSIPVGAIERVEILNNGGSAIYGSDAIGGVVNVITKQNFNGLTAEGYYGETSHGDGAQKTASLTVGSSSSGLSSLFFVNYYINGGIKESDRDISSSSDQRRLGGIDYSSGVGNPPTIQLSDSSGTSHVFNLCDPSTVSGGRCTTNRNAYTPLSPPSNRLSIFGSLNKELINSNSFTLNAYADALINKSSVKTSYYPTPISTGNDPDLISGAGNPFTAAFIAAQNPAPPAAATYPSQDAFIRYDFTEVGPRLDTYDDLQDRYTVGLKGSFLQDWSFDVAGLYSSDTNEDLGNNYVSKPLLVQALTTGLTLTNAAGTTATEFFNAFGGANTPEMINAVKIRLDTHTVTTIRSLDATVSGPIVKFNDGSDISVAVGAERRFEDFDNEPDSTEISGNVVALSSGTGVQAGRTLTGAYAELDGKFREFAELQVAGRHESYSDFGEVTKPKFALKLTPVQWLVIRGGLDKGFRAPSLADLFSAQSSSFTNGIIDSKRCSNTDPTAPAPIDPSVPTSDCDGSSLFKVTVGGNPNLKPEQSRSFYYGFVAEPIKDLSAGFDVFNVRVDDVITTLPAQLLVDTGDPAVVQRGAPTTGAGGAVIPGAISNIFNGFLNGAFLETTGFDADISWVLPGFMLPRTYGKLKSTFSMSYIDKYKYADANNPEASYAGTDAFGLALPRVKAYMQFDYDLASFTGVLRANYVGKYNDDIATGNTVGSFTSWDIQGQYTPSVAPKLKATVGINNLFDRMPPFNPGAGFYTASFSGYDSSLYSAEGRFLYTSLSYSF